jgi:hypothetical protein
LLFFSEDLRKGPSLLVSLLTWAASSPYQTSLSPPLLLLQELRYVQEALLWWIWWVRSIENKNFPTQEHIN